MLSEEKEKMKEKKLSEGIVIKGYVTIWQGEGKDKKMIVNRAENHFVDAGLKGLLSALMGKQTGGGGSGSYVCYCSYSTRYWQAYLGTDTAAPTTHGMTALTAPIGTAPGTTPNSKSGTDRSNPATGRWKTGFTAVWNAGTISGTVGELALYLALFDKMTFEWTANIWSPSTVMVSRLSEADADFSSFTIDVSKSLTVAWEIEVCFA